MTSFQLIWHSKCFVSMFANYCHIFLCATRSHATASCIIFASNTSMAHTVARRLKNLQNNSKGPVQSIIWPRNVEGRMANIFGQKWQKRGLIMLSIAFPCFFSRSFDKKSIEFFSRVFKFSNIFKFFGYGWNFLSRFGRKTPMKPGNRAGAVA